MGWPGTEATAQTRPDAGARPAADNPYDVTTHAPRHLMATSCRISSKIICARAPYIGTGGAVKLDALPTLKRLGFKTIINLNADQLNPPPPGK
ncbi:MAG: hypothetical protein COA65_02240 [Rhodospirillaceae bacterium]|nr:MAG: hypothetical protein COA65_02240 [Rhodospirillaceae bacterium]